MQDAIDAAAGFWDARLRAPACTAEDRRAFEQWRDADVAHRIAFERFQAIVTALRKQKGRPELRAIRDEALATVGRRQRRLSVAIAASVLTLIAVGSVTWLGARWLGHAGLREEVYTTGMGQRSTVTLQDGSALELNSKTEIKVAFNSAQRDVTLLEGQALFTVAKDAQRPFVVHAAGRDIRAIGTAFDIRLERSSLRVTLLEGKVAVTQAGESQSPGEPSERVVLTPGEQFVARSPQTKTGRARAANEVIHDIDVAKVTDWRNGRVFLEDLTLADAVAEMNKHSAVQITVSDSSLDELRVNGMFRAGEQQAFATALQSYFPIVAHRLDAQRIELQPRR